MKNTEQVQQEYAESKGYETFNHLVETDLNALDYHVSAVQTIYAQEALTFSSTLSLKSNLQKVSKQDVDEGRCNDYERIIK